MSAASIERRLGTLEGLATDLTSYWHRNLGRKIRRLATENDVGCWPASEDARFLRWSRVYASPELREILSAFHDALVERALRDGLDVSGSDLTNPWKDDGGSV